MAVTAVTRIDEFRALERDWNALSSRAPTSCLFNSFDWLDAWWDAFADEDASLHVLCARDASGRLVGALPLMRSGTRRLRSIFNFQSNRSDVLFDRDRPQVVGDLLAHLASAHAGWDVLELVWVPEDSPLFFVLARGAIGDLHVHAVKTNDSPYLDLEPAGFDAWYASCFPPKKRRQDRWTLRQLEKIGGRVEVIRRSDAIHAIVDSILRIEDLGWKARIGGSMNQCPRIRAFVHDIVERASANDTLMIVRAMVHERPAAFLLGIESGGTFNFLKTSYDPTWSALGLGRLVINRAIEASFARNLSRFDFLGAADNYKLRYTETVRPHSTIFVYNSGVFSKLRRAVKRRVIPLTHQILGHQPLYPVLMDR
jgi:CelD/BcsL family acetyltransferase involved in cellulose biosynthesis